MSQAPSIATHIPLIVSGIPAESAEVIDGRPDAPTPSLWQNGSAVTHKVTKRKCVVTRIDYVTRQFRGFFPDENRHSDRTGWENMNDWDVEVTLSPAEIERQNARAKLEEEMTKLDPDSFAAVSVLCDDDDPAKALAKLEAMRRLGVIKVSAAAAQMAMGEKKSK